jgi:hypothetical protein
MRAMRRSQQSLGPLAPSFHHCSDGEYVAFLSGLPVTPDFRRKCATVIGATLSSAGRKSKIGWLNRVVWQPPLRGGVLPADRLSNGRAVVTDTRTGLRAGGGAHHKPKQCHRPAGAPRSSATAAIPTSGG